VNKEDMKDYTRHRVRMSLGASACDLQESCMIQNQKAFPAASGAKLGTLGRFIYTTRSGADRLGYADLITANDTNDDGGRWLCIWYLLGG